MLNFFAQHSLIQGDYNLKDIRVMDEIGRGNSHVYTAFIRDDFIALKQIQIKNDYQYQSFLKEISYMKELSEISKDLIKYYGYFVTMQEINQYSKRKYAHIIMQCAQMNLQNFMTCRINEGKRLNKPQIIQILDFLIDAFAHLERNKIAHCDIKPENILVLNSKTLTMKLCDVGSCKIIDSESVQQATVFGTVPFLAPELVKTKSNKIISSNVFKSDVFSFGLVVLYIITNKKFTSKERIQIPQSAYFEVISQWIKEAREIVNYDSRIAQVLRNSLEFQQFKRPLFKDIKAIYEAQKKRKQTAMDAKLKQLTDKEELQKKAKLQEQYASLNPQSTKKIDLFKTRTNTTKFGMRTTSIGFPRINKNFEKHLSPGSTSPISALSKRQSMCFTHSSPQKNNSIIDYKKIIYVTEEDKQLIAFQYLAQDEKIFVLLTPCPQIKKAECLSLYQPCPLSGIYDISQIQTNKFYLDYENFEGIGADSNCPPLRIKKIYANLHGAELMGGYKHLFRTFCSSQIQYLQIDISGADISFNQVTDLLDRLNGKKLKYLGIIWQGNLMTPEQHSQMMEKISKIAVKKFVFLMNENFIKYEKQSRWPLPKNCQVLYLEYTSNFMEKMISNLSISIPKCPIKELYLNFGNNNLNKSESNILFKSVSSIQTLQKLILNISWNPIQDISYIISSLSDLREVSSLELKLHHSGIPQTQIFQAISEIRPMFDNNLKILKIAYDRRMRTQQFQNHVQKALGDTKFLKIDVLGYDNKYLMAFIKKINKGSRNKSTTTRLKGQKTNMLGFKQPIDEQKQGKKAGICFSFYSNSRNYDNYICLACSDFSELSKNEYFCKYCIENCKHKGHNIVKIYERMKCCCSYSGSCCTQISKRICAEQLKIRYKKVYKCFKCNKRYCQGCISYCKQNHKDWTEETKISIVFQCGSAI